TSSSTSSDQLQVALRGPAPCPHAVGAPHRGEDQRRRRLAAAVGASREADRVLVRVELDESCSDAAALRFVDALPTLAAEVLEERLDFPFPAQLRIGRVRPLAPRDPELLPEVGPDPERDERAPRQDEPGPPLLTRRRGRGDL